MSSGYNHCFCLSRTKNQWVRLREMRVCPITSYELHLGVMSHSQAEDNGSEYYLTLKSYLKYGKIEKDATM